MQNINYYNVCLLSNKFRYFINKINLYSLVALYISVGLCSTNAIFQDCIMTLRHQF